MSRRAIHEGLAELKQKPERKPQERGPRIRRPGGGRKKTLAKDPSLIQDLERLVEPVTRGDPESPLRWTCKSVRKLADE
ncbi:MAG: ISAzo13 family transposase, partial [Acidobacteria bacterium]|nr:ISAzo13 family transposase [Acidobacteriota bacterium]